MQIKRRDFLGFFLIGGLASLVLKKLQTKSLFHPAVSYPGEVRIGEKEAMFWRRKG